MRYINLLITGLIFLASIAAVNAQQMQSGVEELYVKELQISPPSIVIGDNRVDSLYVGGDTQGENGQDVDIFINATNASNIGNLQLDILFDKNIMIANNVTNLISGLESNIDNNTGKVTIELVSTTGVNINGTISKIKFRIVGSEGVSPLNISVIGITDPDSDTVTPDNVINSTFTVRIGQISRVDIHDINDVPSFDPADITILQGTVVNWTNKDNDTQHTATSDTDIFDSGNIRPGESFSYIFNNTGTFGYYCVTHPFMRGQVTVISVHTFNISGYKINDVNGDGLWNNNEIGIPNWNITLATVITGIEIAKTTTNNSGFYNFNNVTNGTYIVTEEVKEEWRNISELSRQVTVAGHDVIEQDFENQLNDTTPPVINSVVLNTANPAVGQAILVTVNATDNIAIISVTANNIELARQDEYIWNGVIIAEEGNHSVNVSVKDIRDNVAWDNSTVYTGAYKSINGTIIGTVTNVFSGEAIAGANVTAGNLRTTTNIVGAYTISITAGTYIMTASASGYDKSSTNIAVVSGETVTRNFSLAHVSPIVDPDVAAYDTDHNDAISRSEAMQTVADYFDNLITKARAVKVVIAYFGVNQ